MARQRKERSEALRIAKSAMAIIRHHAKVSGRNIKAQIDFIVKDWSKNQVPVKQATTDDFQDIM